ncbi:SCO family protein [Haloarcula salina]|uniref:SCO family protein n=1 Tax=Haloarcula salina TaxID=1429914 RepID=A0AA41KJZ2_9EURY|nr:SCO family protein [Haloarcula salina]MBV0901374.1 SCO family protein [Haloarcula salina]
MTHRPSQPTRRTVLRATGSAAAIGLAGCLGPSTPANVELPPPDNYEALQEADLPYPIYGEDLPEATVPDVLSDQPVSSSSLVGDSHLLLTFVYTRCNGICLTLASGLVHAQARAAEGGYTDDLSLAVITFDPATDTPETFTDWAADQGFDFDLGNCYLLRPTSPERARTVVEDTYGEAYEKNPDEGMPFLHMGLTLLVNDEGVVERAYAGSQPQPATIVDDVETLVDG